MVALASCGGDPTGPSVTLVAVTPDTFTLHLGANRTLTAVAMDADSNEVTGVALTWVSSDTMVAKVSAAGKVTARGVGVDTITAASGGVSGFAVVTVDLVPVDSVTVGPSPVTVYLTQTRQLNATPRDSTGHALTGRVVTWASSDTSLATVSASGLVTAKAIGAPVITATVEGKYAEVTVTVDSVPVASILLVPAGDTAIVGDTLDPVAVAKDSAGQVMPGFTATWEVSDSSILQPIPGARFVALANGTVTLTATIRAVHHAAMVEVRTCGDTLQKSAGSFSFPLVSGGLAHLLSVTTDVGLFKGAAAWFGGGVMFGTDSAHMVVDYDPSLILGPGVAARGLCQLSNGPPYVRSSSKVTPLAGLAGPAGLRVVQESFHATSTSADSGFVLLRYTFTNTTGTAMTNLRSGFVVDWDVGTDPGFNNLVYNATNTTHEASESDTVTHTQRLGVVAFDAAGTMTSNGWLNGNDPSTRGAYYGRLAAGNQTGSSGPGDIRALAGVPALTIPAYGRAVVYFAIIGGTTPAKFTASRKAAKALADQLGYQ